MKRFTSMLLTLAAIVIFVPAGWATEVCTVKGTVKDENGKPMPNAVVHIQSKESGRTYDFKTNKNGDYFSLGVVCGTYTFSLMNGNLTVLTFNNVPLKSTIENNIEFDLQKEKARGGNVPTEEERKKIEEAQKENAKIKGLNQSLAEAKTAADAKDYAKAVEIMTQATQGDTTHHLLFFKLADYQRLQAANNPDKAAAKPELMQAIDNYKKALDMAKAENPPVKPELLGAYYNNLADAQLKAGLPDDAIQSYQQAATADPTKSATYEFNEGAVLTNTGKVDQAIATFDKVIAADPTKADAYYWKGVNLMGKATLKGNKMEAPPGTEEAFNKYLELAPTGQFADPAKQMLASMGATVETSYGKSKSAKKK
ncbi:MAG TPA: carboxypeptidase regulatory-like domain-containing protein [Terriglobales bacterium]|nr:carboxypeptidase regulatory-like domain-containing protein [Terriglobales bacterium]